MTQTVTIELRHKNDPEFPRECIEVWQVVEEGDSLGTFETREEAEAFAREYCEETGAVFDEEASD